MKTFLLWMFLLVLGIALGVASTIGILRYNLSDSWTSNGPWRTKQDIGSQDANLYTRAAVAIGGLFALNSKEAIYYVANRDSQGRRLQSRCTYQIKGGALKARWWSITLYGSDFFLIRNKQNRYSYTKEDFAKSPNSWSFQVSTKPQPDHWLDSGNHSELYLTLRLYHPDPSFVATKATARLPVIKRTACGEKR